MERETESELFQQGMTKLLKTLKISFQISNSCTLPLQRLSIMPWRRRLASGERQRSRGGQNGGSGSSGSGSSSGQMKAIVRTTVECKWRTGKMEVRLRTHSPQPSTTGSSVCAVRL
jgi:hypothetical protein